MNTPPLLPPDQMPPIRTPHDMYECWRDLMGELGFSERLLWCAFITTDGRMAPVLPQFDGLPLQPDQDSADGLMSVYRHVLDDIGDDASVAFLLSRPGSAQMAASDRAWARELARAASRADIRLQPIHLATDEAVRVFAADDLLPDTGHQQREHL